VERGLDGLPNELEKLFRLTSKSNVTGMENHTILDNVNQQTKHINDFAVHISYLAVKICKPCQARSWRFAKYIVG
jgi:glutathione peroxidase-family protein